MPVENSAQAPFCAFLYLETIRSRDLVTVSTHLFIHMPGKHQGVRI